MLPVSPMEEEKGPALRFLNKTKDRQLAIITSSNYPRPPRNPSHRLKDGAESVIVLDPGLYPWCTYNIEYSPYITPI